MQHEALYFLLCLTIGRLFLKFHYIFQANGVGISCILPCSGIFVKIQMSDSSLQAQHRGENQRIPFSRRNYERFLSAGRRTANQDLSPVLKCHQRFDFLYLGPVLFLRQQLNGAARTFRIIPIHLCQWYSPHCHSILERNFHLTVYP